MTPAPLPDPVTVTTDKAGYKVGEEIVVTLRNGRAVSIYGLTGRTYCSIVSLQRKETNGWQEQGRCLVGGPPGWVEIRAGATQVVQLAPQLYEDVPLPAGAYRAVFPYKLESTSGSDAATYSPEFVIAP